MLTCEGIAALKLQLQLAAGLQMLQAEQMLPLHWMIVRRQNGLALRFLRFRRVIWPALHVAQKPLRRVGRTHHALRASRAQ